MVEEPKKPVTGRLNLRTRFLVKKTPTRLVATLDYEQTQREGRSLGKLLPSFFVLLVSAASGLVPILILNQWSHRLHLAADTKRRAHCQPRSLRSSQSLLSLASVFGRLTKRSVRRKREHRASRRR